MHARVGAYVWRRKPETVAAGGCFLFEAETCTWGAVGHLQFKFPLGKVTTREVM